MQDEDSSRREGDARSGSGGEEKIERAVLALVLSVHPEPLSIGALASELAGQESEAAERRDAAEQVVESLVAAGLIERSGELVSPTQAARRFDELGL